MPTRNLVFATVAALTACGQSSSRHAPPPASDAAPAPTVERWGGEILVPSSVPLDFELDLDCGTPPHARLAIPAQHVAATEQADVTCTGRSISFTLVLPGVPAAAKARLEASRRDDGTAAGTLHQDGGDFRIEMRRLAGGESVAVGPRRPQTPVPPFPYDDREATYASKDGTQLAGTLSVPRGGGAHAAVLLITGTGTQDRDETLMGHKPFWVLADHLARAGIAVLRVDDRGAGGSGGSNDATDLDRKVEDALAGVAWLAAQPEIDPKRIGLLGHSEGGVIAPMAASSSPGIAFVVLLAAPGVSGAEIGLRQLEAQLRADGVAPDIITARIEGEKQLIALALGGADAATLHDAMATHIDHMSALTGAHLDAAQREAAVQQHLGPLSTAAALSFLRVDPRPALAALRCPVLALWGSLDIQVDPEVNLPAIERALAGDEDVTARVLPGLNHLFQPAQRGTIDEYAAIETTIAPVALDAITTWLLRWKDATP